MSTNSTIAIQNLDGTVDQIYCHWDGNVEHNGFILESFYSDRARLEKLISGGDISSLGPVIADAPKDFDEYHEDFTNYYSYRGEPVRVNHYESFEGYENNLEYMEFNYIFTNDDVWSVIEEGKDWEDLEYRLAITADNCE